jgi:G:T/U-mismatch repair DNA glycosylase
MTEGVEIHPHLSSFDRSVKWKYLIIGTFPPNRSVRDEKKMFVDYFYGNKGFLWRILHDIYQPHGYDFLTEHREEKLRQIKAWQHDFKVGLTDTVKKCRRRSPESPDDADLHIIEYNTELKDYLLNDGAQVRKLLFTSTSGKNSAFANFKKIMGDDISRIADKLVTGLPSPSGSANINYFNGGDEDSLGMQKEFFDYVRAHHPLAIPELTVRWLQKKNRRSQSRELRGSVVVKAAPAGLVKAYKIWKYSQVLPPPPAE